MTDNTGAGRPWSYTDFWTLFMPPRRDGSGALPPGLAPEWLNQPINPGWSLLSVILNSGNSRSPETELRVLREASYGRQLGRIIDVLDAVLDRVGKDSFTGADAVAVEAFLELKRSVDDAKAESRSRWLTEKGMEDLARLLDELKVEDPARHARLAAILRRALG